MRVEDKKEFGALLKDAMAFYRRDTTKFTLDVWWQACQTFDMDQVRKAITAHVMDPERGQFPPMPADIVRALQGTHGDRSLLAWGKVLDTIQRVGAYQSVVFDDPAIHAAITDMGGWVKLCQGEMADLPFVQKRFCDAHKVYTKAPPAAFPPKLVGVHEADNALAGRRVEPPLMIGDPDRALLVLKNGTAGALVKVTPLGQIAAPDAPKAIAA